MAGGCSWGLEEHQSGWGGLVLYRAAYGRIHRRKVRNPYKPSGRSWAKEDRYTSRNGYRSEGESWDRCQPGTAIVVVARTWLRTIPGASAPVVSAPRAISSLPRPRCPLRGRTPGDFPSAGADGRQRPCRTEHHRGWRTRPGWSVGVSHAQALTGLPAPGDQSCGGCC